MARLARIARVCVCWQDKHKVLLYMLHCKHTQRQWGHRVTPHTLPLPLPHTHTPYPHTRIEITQCARGVLKEESNASSDADGQGVERRQSAGGREGQASVLPTANWQLATVDGGQNQNADEQANEKVFFFQAQKAKSKGSGGGNRTQFVAHTHTHNTHRAHTYEKSLRCC